MPFSQLGVLVWILGGIGEDEEEDGDGDEGFFATALCGVFGDDGTEDVLETDELCRRGFI